MKKIIISTLILTSIISFNVNAATTATGSGINSSTQDQGTSDQSGDQGTSDQSGNQGTSNQSGSGSGTGFPGSGNNNSNNWKSDIGVPKLSLAGFVDWTTGLMTNVIYLIISASLVVFLFGVFKLAFVDGQKPEAREQARKFMFWGIVALFVMVSVWGLVNLLRNTFNLDNSNIPSSPSLPRQG